MKNINLVSIRMITAEIQTLVAFYEKATGINARWLTPDFAEIPTGTFTLAIGSTRTLAFFGEGVAQPAANKSVIIEFLVENVDADYERIKELTGDIVQQPTTMPWGNRSLLFRDTDGNLVNFFTPVSAEAIKRFS